MNHLLVALSAAVLVASPASSQVAPGDGGQDRDERGLWMQVEEYERQLKASDFVIRDPALNAYVGEVFCRTVGPGCADVRIYIVRTPYFNASMAPNGMMALWSGLFLRTRDEAQLAAVLAHEYVHYRERHSLQLLRDVRGKTNAFSLLGLPLAVLGGSAGYTLGQLALVASVYGFSRDMERQADAGSLTLLGQAGYDPAAASAVWRQVEAEREATGRERKKKPRGEGGLFATHPTTAERLRTLAAMAGQTPVTGTPTTARDRYRAALAPHWAQLVDDQIKLNDLGATEMLLGELAAEGWTPDLLYARGELYRARGRPDDLARAADAYRQAIAGQAPAEAQRGLGLTLLRSGDAAGGRAALAAYVAARPDAADAPMMKQLAGL